MNERVDDASDFGVGDGTSDGALLGIAVGKDDGTSDGAIFILCKYLVNNG